MVDVKVIDTGVLIGASETLDQHHESCLDYLNEAKAIAWATPTVVDEYEAKINEIRSALVAEVKEHRERLSERFAGRQLDVGDLVELKENVLDVDLNCHRFLYAYYDELRTDAPIACSVVLDRLSDVIEEIREDKSREKSGIWGLVRKLTGRIPDHPDVRRELLIEAGNDQDICIEAHHIAENEDGHTEFATVDKNHFLKKHPGEPESREENVLRVTGIRSIKELTHGPYPWT